METTVHIDLRIVSIPYGLLDTDRWKDKKERG